MLWPALPYLLGGYGYRERLHQIPISGAGHRHTPSQSVSRGHTDDAPPFIDVPLKSLLVFWTPRSRSTLALPRVYWLAYQHQPLGHSMEVLVPFSMSPDPFRWVTVALSLCLDAISAQANLPRYVLNSCHHIIARFHLPMLSLIVYQAPNFYAVISTHALDFLCGFNPHIDSLSRFQLPMIHVPCCLINVVTTTQAVQDEYQ